MTSPNSSCTMVYKPSCSTLVRYSFAQFFCSSGSAVDFGQIIQLSFKEKATMMGRIYILNIFIFSYILCQGFPLLSLNSVTLTILNLLTLQSSNQLDCNHLLIKNCKAHTQTHTGCLLLFMFLCVDYRPYLSGLTYCCHWILPCVFVRVYLYGSVFPSGTCSYSVSIWVHL